MLQGHGDDIHKNCNIEANFSTNVWYEGDNSWLKQLVTDKWETLIHYPEPDALSLRQCIAKHHNISEDQLIIGNGATEIFYLVAHAFSSSRTLIPVPSFAEYEDACKAHNHNITYCPIDDIESMDNQHDLVIICNPNNPNGKIYSREEITVILEQFDKAHLLIDEAFIDFTTGTDTALDLVSKYPRLMISRSMTKNYSIPGLRLGYLISSLATIENINRYKQPWSVNALAIEAGKYLIANSANLLPDAELLNQNRQAFQEKITNIPGYKALPSSSPFFLIETPIASLELKQVLIERYNILVRDASNFKNLGSNYIRVNTLSEDKNELLIKALKDYGI